MADNELEKNKRLKEIRIDLDLTQQRMADELGIERPNLSGIENNKDGRKVPNDTIYILEKKFNVNPEWFNTGIGEKFLEVKKEEESSDGIPMFNYPGSASNVEMYGDPSDIKIVGYLNIPGATKDSFALPVHGNSMYPTLENGSWCVLRPIEDRTDIQWGEIYYIEYGDYRLFKRLIATESEDSVTLWSDNQSELIGGKPKYAAKTIKTERITKLCLLTDILKKPNY